MRHTAIYLRVSTKKQSHRSQRPDLQRWADAQDGPCVWYTDKATGTNMDRPGWRKLEAAMRAGHVLCVTVFSIDRLGRSAKGLTALFAELQERKVGLITLKEGLSLNTPSGRLMATVIAGCSQWESEIKAEKILAGQAAARAKGKTWGGSKKGVPRKLKPDVVEVIRTMKVDGATITRICKVMTLSRPTVCGVIKRLREQEQLNEQELVPHECT